MMIKKCGRNEYAEMLAMANKAFGLDENELEDTEACILREDEITDELVSNYFIAVRDDEVIGCAGAYPRDVKINGGAVVKTFGVGQVCCKKEEREHGVMTALMNALCGEMVKNGAVLGYLWGNIPRYRHYNFLPAGGRVEFTGIKIHRLLRVADTNNFMVRTAEPRDIADLSFLYDKFEACALRDEVRWRDIIGKYGVELLYAPGGDTRGAYLIAKPGSDHIMELQGDSGAAKKLLLHYMQKYGHERISVRYPFIRHNNDPVFNMLNDISSWFSVEPSALAAVYGDDSETAKIFWDDGPDGAFWISEPDEV